MSFLGRGRGQSMCRRINNFVVTSVCYARYTYMVKRWLRVTMSARVVTIAGPSRRGWDGGPGGRSNG